MTSAGHPTGTPHTPPTLRWGFIGNSRIAQRKALPALQHSHSGIAVAIASRDPAGAQATATRFGIPRVYSSYQALLHDPEIDAVYISVPNALHFDECLAALQADKHVLCEKPLTMNALEAIRLRDESRRRGRVLLEGCMIFHHPQWIRLLDDGLWAELGDIRLLQGAFCFQLSSLENIRASAELGGGALGDLGFYPLSAATRLLGVLPSRVCAHSAPLARAQVDGHTHMTLEYASGAVAQFSCSLDAFATQYLTIVGARKSMDLRRPYNPAPGEQPGLVVRELTAQGDPVARELPSEAGDQFSLQFDAFARTVGGAAPRYPLDASIEVQRLIDAIRRSASTHSWIEIGEESS